MQGDERTDSTDPPTARSVWTQDVSDVFLVTNSRRQITGVNRAALEMLGYKQSEIYGRGILKVAPELAGELGGRPRQGSPVATHFLHADGSRVAVRARITVNPAGFSMIWAHAAEALAEHSPDVAQPEAIQVVERPAVAAAASRRVLFVEDEASLAYLGSMMLASIGFESETAETVDEALEALTSGKPRYDLVLTDYFLPRKNGLSSPNGSGRSRPGSRSSW